jgi:hypothetical protein
MHTAYSIKMDGPSHAISRDENVLDRFPIGSLSREKKRRVIRVSISFRGEPFPLHVVNEISYVARSRAIPRRESRKSRSSVSAVRKRSRRFHVATTVGGELDPVYLHPFTRAANSYPRASLIAFTSQRPLDVIDSEIGISLSSLTSFLSPSGEDSRAHRKAFDRSAEKIAPFPRLTVIAIAV